MSRWQVVAILGLSAFFRADVAFAQCAMCRRALESPEGALVAAAFRSGILLLLAAPFLLFGAVAVLAVRAERRSAAAQQPALMGPTTHRTHDP
jgi:hypothetical protein